MSIPFEQFEKAVKSAGLKLSKQAAFAKVAIGKAAVYIALTQKVSRVDLSGFSFSHPAVHKLSDKELSGGKYGRVIAQLDFSKSDERVMEAFSTALSKMKQLASEKETEAKAKKKSSKKKYTKKAPTAHAPAPSTEVQASA